MDRADYLRSLIGKPWHPQGEGPDVYSCWGLFCEVEMALWGRCLPHVDVPFGATLRWMVETIGSHDQRNDWVEFEMTQGVITAADGAGVLMARGSRPAHIGVWLAEEGGILHADEKQGVSFDTPAALKADRWGRLSFFEPIQDI